MSKLKKELGLKDVYAICVGAMFSSGFFLLPGFAADATGSSVVLAYALAGVLMIPTILSQAELSTAMPQASGTYFFIDRSMGSLMGTVGGLGSWLALVFKSAFSLIGMGAYLTLIYDVNIKVVAVVLTILFGLLNIVGAKETAGLQKLLVLSILFIMGLFLLEGGTMLVSDFPKERFTPFFKGGSQGFLHATAMVFVAYAGLTKAASMAEEVRDPDRNLPKGMILSLFTATVLNVLGVLIIVAALGSETLPDNMTPVTSAASEFMSWVPAQWSHYLIIAAAFAAFASTGNAGLMASSRYPYAMAKDHLFPESIGQLGKHKTPTRAILITMATMIVFELLLTPETVAKYASTMQLLIFALINGAVIIMRESRIEEYRPGFKAPFYPWPQIIGIVSSLVLVAYLGWVPFLSAVAVIVFALLWHHFYSKNKIERTGAIYHMYRRLGDHRNGRINDELREINEKKINASN